VPPTETSVMLGSVVHIIQIALTPVFLLSGIATLLNVFSTRLARVSDRVDQLSQIFVGKRCPPMRVHELTKRARRLR